MKYDTVCVMVNPDTKNAIYLAMKGVFAGYVFGKSIDFDVHVETEVDLNTTLNKISERLQCSKESITFAAIGLLREYEDKGKNA